MANYNNNWWNCFSYKFNHDDSFSYQELISIENSDIINGVFNVPNGVKIIGTAVFEKNDKIRVINIPDSVEEIGVHAFSSCKNLVANSSLVIPNSFMQGKT